MDYDLIFSNIKNSIKKLDDIDYSSKSLESIKLENIAIYEDVANQVKAALSQILDDFNVSQSIGSKLANLATSAIKLSADAANLEASKEDASSLASLSLALANDGYELTQAIMHAADKSNENFDALSKILANHLANLQTSASKLANSSSSSEVIDFISNLNNIITDSLNILNPHPVLNHLISTLSKSALESSSLINQIILNSSDKDLIINNSFNLASELNLCLKELINLSDSVDKNLLNIVSSNVASALEDLASNAVALSTAKDAASIATHTSKLLDDINSSIAKVLTESKLETNASKNIQSAISKALQIAQISSSISAQTNEEIASSALKISSIASLAIEELVQAANAGSELSKQIAQDLARGLENLETDLKIAVNSNNPQTLSQACIELLSKLNDTASTIAKSAGANSELADGIHASIHSAFSLAAQISKSTSASNKEQYTDSAFNIAISANELIKEILKTTNAVDNQLLEKVSSSVSSGLDKLKLSASEIAAINPQDANAKAMLAKSSLKLIAGTNELIKDSLASAGVESKLGENIQATIDQFINIAKSAADIALSEQTSSKAEFGMDLIVGTNEAIAKILELANVEQNISPSISVALNGLKSDIAALSEQFASSKDVASLCDQTFTLINKANDALKDVLNTAGVKSSNEINLILHNVINAGQNIAQIATTQKASVATASVDLFINTNELIKEILKTTNAVDNQLLEKVSSSVSSGLDKLKLSASEIAAINPQDANAKAMLAKSSLKLIAGTNELIKDSLASAGVESKLGENISNIADEMLKAASVITDVVSASLQDDKEQIANSSIELAKSAVSSIDQILQTANIDASKINQSLISSLDAAKTSASALAKIADSKDGSKIAIASLDLIKDANALIKNALNAAGYDEATTQNISKIGDGLLNASKSISLLAGLDYSSQQAKTAVASTSMTLLENANELIKDILNTAKVGDAVQNEAISAAVANSLVNIKQSAISLAQIDASSSNGKAQIANESLNLLDGANVLIKDALHASGKDNQLIDSVSNIASSALNLGKIIANLSAVDASDSKGKEDIANASVDLLKTINDISIQAAKIADSSKLVAAGEYLQTRLDEFKQSASVLASTPANSAENKGLIASASLGLIQQANDVLKGALMASGVDTHISNSIAQIADTSLQIGKHISLIASVDASSDEGKAVLGSNCIAMILGANKLIKDSLNAAHVDNKIINSLVDSTSNLSKLGEQISKLVISADTSTTAGNVAIANDSFEIASGANHLIADVLNAANLSSDTGAKASGIADGVFALGKSIASIVGADINTAEGKAQIASGSLKILGDTNGLVKDVLELSKQSNAISTAITSVADGMLQSVADLVSSSLKLHNFSALSKGDQIAVGFDVGLKALSTVATGVSSVAGAVNAVNGLSNSIPVIGQAVSSAALAISPLEIKALVDQHENVSNIRKSDAEFSKLGYAGDGVLADIKHQQFALETGYFAANTAMTIASSAIAAAASATVIGAPIALVTGLIQGVVSGVLSAVKQPALEHIADKYKKQILASEDANAYFEHNSKANLNKLYESESFQEYLKNLETAFGVKQIINLDGVGLNDNALELAGITGLSDQMRKANNYATLIRDGKVSQTDDHQALCLNQETGELNIQGFDNALINFNTPLFAPGVELSSREKIGKNSYYNSLIINGPDRYTITDNGLNNTYVSDDKYASILFDKDGNIIKKITLDIQAGKGNDTYIADAGFSHFDGGEGDNSVAYNKASIHGIKAHYNASDKSYEVIKNIVDADIAVERIKTKEVQYGKRTEKIDYRELSIEKHSYEAIDKLINVKTISGSDYADEMIGGDGDDYFLGQDGDDVLIGNGGNDVLLGGAGNDTLYGGDGDDILDGGSGSDKIYGGAGNDRIIQSDNESADYIDGGDGVDTLDLHNMDTNRLIFKEDFSEFDRSQTDYELVDDVQASSQVGISDTTKWGVASASALDGGKFLFVDGSSDANKAVFNKLVNLETDQIYEMSFDLTYNAGTKLALFIDDEKIGEFSASSDDNHWQKYSLSFKASKSALAKLSIKDMCTSTLANDFAIDNIELHQKNVGVWLDLSKNEMIKGADVKDVVLNIENVIATDGDDVIIASDLGSSIFAGAGDDVLYGGAQADVLIGGAGRNEMYGKGGDDSYFVLASARNIIKDEEGTNTLSLNSESRKINLKASWDAKSKCLDLSSYDNSNLIGKTSIEAFDKFGFIKLDDMYYLGLKSSDAASFEDGELNVNFKAILGSAEDELLNVDLSKSALNFYSEDNILDIYAQAKTSYIKLDSEHTNHINVQSGTNLIISNFDTSKDALVYSTLSSAKYSDGNLLLQIDEDTSVTLLGVHDELVNA